MLPFFTIVPSVHAGSLLLSPYYAQQDKPVLHVAWMENTPCCAPAFRVQLHKLKVTRHGFCLIGAGHLRGKPCDRSSLRLRVAPALQKLLSLCPPTSASACRLQLCSAQCNSLIRQACGRVMLHASYVSGTCRQEGRHAWSIPCSGEERVAALLSQEACSACRGLHASALQHVHAVSPPSSSALSSTGPTCRRPVQWKHTASCLARWWWAAKGWCKGKAAPEYKCFIMPVLPELPDAS